MTNTLRVVLASALQVYMWLVFAYVLTSWFQQVRWVQDVRRALEPICEPYLQVFRRIMPVSGGLDFSPAVAIIVLSLLRNVVAG